MLEGLDQIDWASLHHAYGSATDVPELLRDLISDDGRARVDALDTLFTNIWHQGTVYEASPVAAAFLIELVGDRSVQQRPMLLWLLTNLAMSPILDMGVDALLAHLGPFGTDPERRQVAERDLIWARATHDAVSQGAPVFMRLLRDDEPEVAASAGFILSCFRERAAEITSELRMVLNEQLPTEVKVSIILCLGTLSDGAPQDIAWFEHLLNADSPESIRLACAMALARAWRDAEPDRAASVLEAAGNSPGWDLGLVPWVDVTEIYGEHEREPFDTLYAPLFDQHATEDQQDYFDYIHGYVCAP